MDRLIGGAMEASLKSASIRTRPARIRCSSTRSADPDNPWQLPRPEAVVVVGLGDEGELCAPPTSCTRCARRSIAWAQRMAETNADAPALFELAATLIGSGGTGITVGQSAQLIAQGVREANERARGRRERNQGTRGRPQAAAADGRVSATCIWSSCISIARPRRGARCRCRRRPRPAAMPSTDIVRSRHRRAAPPARRGLSRRRLRLHHAPSHGRGPHDDAMIAYTLDTKRARTEVRAQATQGPLLRELVASASNDQNTDRAHRPHAVPAAGARRDRAVPRRHHRDADRARQRHRRHPLGAARHRAGTRQPRRPPWAIRAKLLRKLRTAEFRQHVVRRRRRRERARDRRAEVRPSQLPAAARRARSEAQCGDRALEDAPARQQVTALISPEDPAQSVPTHGPSSTRCWSATGASCTSPATASRPRCSGPYRRSVATRRRTRRPARRGALGRYVPRPARDPQHARRARAGVRQLLPSWPRDNPSEVLELQRLRSRALRRERRRGADQDRRALRHRRRLGGGGRCRR